MVAAFSARILSAFHRIAAEVILPITLSGVSVELIDTTGSEESGSASVCFSLRRSISSRPTILEPGPVLVNVLYGNRLIALGYMQSATFSSGAFSGEWGWAREFWQETLA